MGSVIPVLCLIISRHDGNMLLPKGEKPQGRSKDEPPDLECVNMLEQEHYAGNWDILRPAKEVEDYNLVSSEELKALMQEAERIMEGWENTNE